ncbi:sensory protein TspO [Brevundimonas sp. LM2]|uniref:TspO/MBR family protein n=1 Tax=Brevundimonas sp. LM2 TaxID=1938605 RepID=UPI000983FD32|nr:TspO/MBR family protein [Brevundimonas sp. LM2]AQR61333.1 sensory protein TspO [Brevundimonas sp. LM2]
MDQPAWIAIAVFVGLNFAAASSGSLFKPGAWYADLNKPSWTPPNLAFPIVWGLLFSINAWAGWLVWETVGTSSPLAFGLYVVSLCLNAGWSFLFFGRRRMDLALIDVAFLWLSLLAIIAVFWGLRPFAALLLLPYLTWVTIASALNLRMIQLNPQAR